MINNSIGNLQQFLNDCKAYNEMYKNDGYILTLEHVIETLEQDLADLKIGHLQDDEN